MYLKAKLMLPCLLVAGLAMGSCSTSNDEPETPGNPDKEEPVNPDPEKPGETVIGSPSNVFVNAVPKAAAHVKSIILDEKGRVSTLKSDNGDVTFTYAQARAAQSYDVLMKVDGYDLYLTLGDNGFVKTANEYEDGENTNNFTLEYADNGHLTKVIHEEDRRLDIHYDAEEDIVQVDYYPWEESDFSSNAEKTYVHYTSDSHPSKVENKGCIMLWYYIFDIDMDRLEYAYYAGLLGKATRHLPWKSGEYDVTWKLNAMGYPIEVTVSDEKYTFSW